MQVFYLKVIHNQQINRKNSTNFASLQKHTKIYFQHFGYSPGDFIHAKCAVRWQTIYTTFKHVAWVAARRLTALKT